MPDAVPPRSASRRAVDGVIGPIMVAVAGALGASGVALAAAAAHRGGGDIVEVAATFALLHAAAILALASGASRDPGLAPGLLVGAVAMAFGTVLFSGDLALAGLWESRPLPQAAPIGGTILILAWLIVTGAGVAGALRRRG